MPDQRGAGQIWPDPNWRDAQEDPCSCVAGDGTNECERYDECYEAWHRAQEAARWAST